MGDKKSHSSKFSNWKKILKNTRIIELITALITLTTAVIYFFLQIYPNLVATTSSTTTNLVINDSFEETTSDWADNWTRLSPLFTIDKNSNGNNGTNSLHLSSPNTEIVHVLSSKIDVAWGNSYKWKQYVKTLRANGEFIFYIDEYNESGKRISGQWKGNITEVMTGQREFKYTPSNNMVKEVSLQYAAWPNSEFDIYIDSIVFVKN